MPSDAPQVCVICGARRVSAVVIRADGTEFQRTLDRLNLEMVWLFWKLTGGKDAS